MIYPTFPMTLNCFEIFFLHDILEKFLRSFQAINEEIKTMNVQFEKKSLQRVQDLSSIHFTLVTLAMKICENFEVTLIAFLVLWLETTIETVYFMVVLMARGSTWVLTYVCNGINVMYYFFWLYVVVKIFARVQSEANGTSELVHDMWRKHTRKGLVKRMRPLQLVSVGLLNNKLRFRARGTFDLNWTFCHTVRTVFDG